MQGPIAQIISLALYGNYYLQGNKPIPAFFPSNSSCQFCEYIHFVDLSIRNGKILETLYTNTPEEWFAKLKEDEVLALKLYYISNNIDANKIFAGFTTGTREYWEINALKKSGKDSWAARWVTGNENRVDNKIWRVTYGRSEYSQEIICQPNQELSKIKEEFSYTLQEIITFARSQDLNYFADCFEKALTELYSDNPFQQVYHKDMVPDGLLGLTARQLLAASQAAWVFGGMGSWNDLGFDGENQVKYEQLSNLLYELLNKSCVAAVNSASKIDFKKRWFEFWK